MTDYRSIEELWVYRDNQRLATLRRLPRGCEFRYLDPFLESAEPAVALHLPKTGEGLRVEGLANLPTYFAGLLPEGVMFSAVRNLIGSAADDLFAVLAATGADAIGDIDVRLPGEDERKPITRLREALGQIEDLLGPSGRFPPNRLAAIPGVQPKLSLGALVRAQRGAAYIAKFNPPEFPSLVGNEFACMRLAKRVRLDVAEVTLRSNSLLVRRFDRFRVSGSDAAGKVHVEDTLQAMDLFPNAKYSLDYGELVGAMAGLGVSKASLLDALRLYAFSYIVGNGDLHAKNVSLVFEGGQWRLSPAYDLLSTLPYGNVLAGADRMALALRDEAVGRFTVDDFVRFGKSFDLPERAVRQMVARTAHDVVRFAPGLLQPHIGSDVVEIVLDRAKSLV